MLAIVTNRAVTDSVINKKMPVDFASYLLAASPPGLDYYALRNQISAVNGYSRRQKDLAKPKVITINTSKACGFEGFNVNTNNNDDGDSGDESVCNSPEPRSGKTSPLTPSSPVGKMGKKKVSFADELGKELVSVRIMKEPSEMPPTLDPEILSSLTLGATAGVTEVPPLVLQFSQPASDYLAFREKIEANCVSLENVILKDYNLMGTVKVKNISFEKSVKIRWTCDSWESHSDIDATYAPTFGSSHSKFDTFSFEVAIPPDMDMHKTVQFAVCYEADRQQFWDNNGGENYKVTTADWNSISSQPKQWDSNNIFNLSRKNDDWTAFSSWNEVPSRDTYW